MNPATPLNLVTARTLPTKKCMKSQHFLSPYRRAPGQTTVEFALICLPFFAILFAIVDYAQIYFYENALQNAMREAARFATAGRVIQLTYADGSTVYETNNGVVIPKAIPSAYGGGEASRNECIRYWFLSNCVIQIPLTSIGIFSGKAPEGDPPSTTTNSIGKLTLMSTYPDPNSGDLITTAATPGPGAANDYVQIVANYQINTITPLFGYLGGYSRQGWNKYPVYVSAIVKNEPALLNFQHTNIYSSEPAYIPGS